MNDVGWIMELKSDTEIIGNGVVEIISGTLIIEGDGDVDSDTL